MPDLWTPSDMGRESNYVVVPISKLEKYIMSSVRGSHINTSNKISIMRYDDDRFFITMPKKKAFISIYTNLDVIKLTENSRDGFEMVSGNMRAYVSVDKMPKLIKLFGEVFSLSLQVPKNLYESIVGKDAPKISSNSEDSITQDAIRIFEHDKELFEGKLKKQTDAINKQKRSVSKTKKKDYEEDEILLLELEAEAIIIMQMQGNNYKQVAGFNQRRLF